MLRFITLLLACSLAACDSSSIQWSEPVALGGPDGAPIALDSSGRPREIPSPATASPRPIAPGMCPLSLRTATSAARLRAVWWSLRTDSSATLYSAASSDSGRTWSAPVAVDTQDVKTIGCDRPAPSLATVGDDLQIVYSMRAPEGTGIFLAHFMGSMLHAPVAILYGDHLVATSVAAQGDNVAVAYEDPNGSRARVDVALSSTQGHIFDVRTTASRDVDLASAPAVALAGHEVAVAWSTRRAEDSAATRVVRIGRFQ